MDHKDDLNPPEEPRQEEAEEEDYQEEEEETDKDDEVDEEHLTRKTRSGKAYSMHFHPSYQTMSWNSPQLDLNTTSKRAREVQSYPFPPTAC